MDDPPQTQEGFSQDECIEWEENRNVDLRQLARSPHMQMTPALLRGTQASSAKQSSCANNKDDNVTPQTASLVKNLDQNYSPKQEIAHLMEKGAAAAAHNDSTQPQANVTAKTSAAEALGMRHGRRRRESSSATSMQPKKLKRSNTDPSVKGRRRPRSSDGSSSNNGQHSKQVSSTSLSDTGVNYFEDLLKELDQPRAPLHPTKVNMSEMGTSARKPMPIPSFASRPTPAPGPRPVAPAAPPPPVQRQSTVNSIIVPKPLQTSDRSQNANPRPTVNAMSLATAPVPTATKPLPVSATNTAGNSIHNQPVNNNKGPVSSAQGSTRDTPAVKTSSSTSATLSSSLFIGDDLQLSEDDWAQMDALMTRAQATRSIPSSAPPAPKLHSERDWKAIQAIDESLARRAVGHPSADNKPATTKEDEFDDFPMIDFEAMDRQIAERSCAVATSNTCAAPATDLPVRNQVSPTFDPQRSFIAFTRYKVVGTEVDNTTYTKTVILKEWSVAMLKDERRRQSSIHFASLERANSTTETQVESPDGRIYLRGEWYHTHVEAGDVVHLCSLSGKFRTDVGALPVILHTSPAQGSDPDDDLVLIVHPDRLIPPTTISETVTCSRRAVLRMRLGSSGMSSKAALLGTMRHELFGRCMSNQDFGWPTAKVFADNIIRRNAESLVGSGVNYAEARETLLRVVPQIQRFAKDYTTFIKDKAGQPANSAVNNRLKGNGLQPDIEFVARSIEATEESVVCPELGLKGNLDLTVNATTSALPPTGADQVQVDPVSAVPQNSLMSIELKTGHNQNPQNAHMAQLALYTMMLRVRRGPNRPNLSLSQSSSKETQGACESGMLLYLNDENYRAMHISPMQNEIKSLVGQRNLVASELARVSRPRGVVLAYEEEQGDRFAGGAPTEKEKPSISLLPAPPAALPEVLSASHSCSRCYMNRECMTYAAAQLKVPSSVSAHGVDKSHAKLLQLFTGHLSEEYLAYFQEWDRLIDLEADASASLIATAWLQSSQEQEKESGKCISSLVLNEMETMMANASDPAAANDHCSALIVLNRAPESSLTTPLSRLSIEKGSHVVVSSDATSLHLSSRHHEPMTQYDDTRPGGQHLRHRMSIARGFLDDIDENQVTIRITRDEMSQLSRLNQQYSDSHRSSPGGASLPPSLRFRVDKDDVSTGTGTLRQNLIKFLTADVKLADEKEAATRATQQQHRTSQDSPLPARQRLQWLREAIIHLKPPSFDNNLSTRMFQGKGDFSSLAAEFSALNHDQKKAVEKIMCAKDYSLIQGLPGTGKTSTIAFVARLLAAHGKRVLVTSYTHAAVDNLMMKLIESGLAESKTSAPLVRVGNKASCHPNVHSILASAIAIAREGEEGHGKRFPSPDSLSSVMSSAEIVGVSALTIPRSSLLVGQHYDVVIVDEAGQISQPAILGALMAADSFVLVGDHMQLPPLVHSEAAESGGYNISMLKRLADKHPSSVAQLALQYRMHGAICQLSNDIVYAGKLKCANKDIETRLLDLSGFPAAVFNNVNGDPVSSWMTKAIDPARPVVFLDTDRIQRKNTPKKPNGAESQTFTASLERTTGKNGKGNIVNDTEAMLVRQVLHALMECGLEPSKIGVICPFRSQLRLLSQNVSIEEWKSKGTEFSTIDRYQGRDKPVIVLSLVRSNPNGNCGRLLEDFRRLNVAVSRAKHKLVLIGSFTTLTKGSEVLRPVLEKIQERGQIVQLPENATQSYKQV